MRIVAENIEKKFNHRQIFQEISFELNEVDSLVITGANGTGKTTLVRIISGLLSPTSGKLSYFQKDQKISHEAIYNRIGLVGPYLQLYKDLTARENLTFFAKARDGKVNTGRILELMEYVGLGGREHDTLKTYSSGMLQRVKYVAALYHYPEVLILDEPTANLDEKGKNLVQDIIERHKQQHTVIIATNEVEEIKFGAKRVEVA
jgi:heme exporter protein A